MIKKRKYDIILLNEHEPLVETWAYYGCAWGIKVFRGHRSGSQVTKGWEKLRKYMFP